MQKILWKIGGQAGFGIMTTGLMFSKYASRAGFQVYDYAEYPSLIRGGHNTYEVVAADSKVMSTFKKIDILVCLNEETYQLHRSRLIKESLIVYDEEEFKIKAQHELIKLPLEKIRAKYSADEAMNNTIFLGASIALLNGRLELLNVLIKETFIKKDIQVTKTNLALAKAGYDYVKKKYANRVKKNLFTQKKAIKQLVATGNEIMSLAAVVADCRFYVAYPMTPALSILTWLAAWQEQTGMVVRHAEDEIAVINTAIGGAFTGVRSAVGTSGGGFALMTETISLAGITEIPLVIFLSQRPGPATGMPTWTEQGDLLFAINAGHGEFPKIVLAPGDNEEIFALTLKAFNLADIYQVPVIIMLDKLLSESHESVNLKKLETLIEQYQIKRGKIVSKPSSSKYLRYKDTVNGISEMLIPGYKKHFYQANSYEHLENGYTTEDEQQRVIQVDKRSRKIKTYLEHDYALPTVYGDLDQAELVFVAWGSMKGTVLEAMRIMDKKTALIHFTHIYPLASAAIKALFSFNKKYVLVENNATGQFGKLLCQETGIKIKNKLLKYNGKPWWAEEIVKNLEFRIL